jgi:hypothetical protein
MNFLSIDLIFFFIQGFDLVGYGFDIHDGLSSSFCFSQAKACGYRLIPHSEFRTPHL